MDWEAQVWKMLALFGCIVAFAYFAINHFNEYSDDLDLIKLQESNASTIAFQTERQKYLSLLQKEADVANAAAKVVEEKIKLNANRTQELEELRGKSFELLTSIQKIGDEIVLAQKNYLASIQVTIQASQGRKFADFNSGSRQTLTNPVLVSATADEATFRTDSGVTKVKMTDLPDMVLSELRYPSPAIVQQVVKEVKEYEASRPKESLVLAPVESEPESPVSDSSQFGEPSQMNRTEIQQGKMPAAQVNASAINSLKARIVQAEQQRDAFRAKANELRSKPRGTISSRDGIIKAHEANAARIDAQIRAMQQQIAELSKN